MDLYETIPESLSKWNDDELFYRGYYFAEEADIVDAFLEKNMPADPALLEHVKNPEKIDPEKTEEMFFSDERNVTIIKHPRFFPVFDHKHTFFEILYVATGNCRQIFPGKTVELHAGDCCLIAPGVRHAISVFDDSIVLNILIRRSTFLDIFLNAVQSRSQLSLFFLGSLYEHRKTRFLIYRTNDDTRLKGYIMEMFYELTHFDAYSDRITCSLLTIFFNQLTRRFGSSVETPESKGNDNAQGEAIINYIISNYADVSIRSLSEHFHFSEPYCSKLVKEASGSTFSELLTSIRMRQSENLLAHTQLSVEEISYQVGYKNPASFIRCFKRIYKISPSQYRKNPDRAPV